MEIAAGHAGAGAEDEHGVEPASGERSAGTPLPGGDELDEALRALGVEPLPPAAPDDDDPAVSAETPQSADADSDLEPSAAPAAEGAAPEPADPAPGASDEGTTDPGVPPVVPTDETSAVGQRQEPDELRGGPDVDPEWPPRAQQFYEPRRTESSPQDRGPVMRTTGSPFGTSPAPASRAYRRLRRIFPG
jgi:hypothetical protein